jgi:hypothetical protein
VIGQYDNLWAELKAQARTENPPAEDLADPFRLDFDHVFEPYWSRQLPEETPLSVGHRGREFLATAEPPAVYADLTPWIDPGFLGRIVAAVAESGSGLAELRVTFPDRDPEAVAGHVLWLLKHDYLRLTLD